jgi:hypothetical protein
MRQAPQSKDSPAHRGQGAVQQMPVPEAEEGHSTMTAKLKLVASRPSEKTYGSPSFISIGRNTSLKSPTKFVATVKGENDVII